MKRLFISLICAPLILMGGCQSGPHQDDFAQKTRRTYNPETGGFEQSPPFGKQGNKSDTEGQ